MEPFLLFKRSSYSSSHSGTGQDYFAEIPNAWQYKQLFMEAVQVAFTGSGEVAFALEYSILGETWEAVETLLAANGTVQHRLAKSTGAFSGRARVKMTVTAGASGGMATVEVWGMGKTVG